MIRSSIRYAGPSCMSIFDKGAFEACETYYVAGYMSVFCLFLHICHSCSIEVLHQGGDSRVNFSNPLSDTGDCPGQLRVAIDGSDGSPLPCSPSCYTH